MAAESEFHAELFSALAEYAAEADAGFEGLPGDDPTDDRLREFVEGIRESGDELAGDDLGRIYRDLLADDRGDLGRFYTPPAVGRILSRWAIRSPDDRCLDPCCGTGAITVQAYRRYEELGLSHPEILDRIAAVDLDGTALRLAALALRAQDGTADRDDTPAVRDDGDPAASSVRHADFFDLDPGAVGTFDATVANPPYVRQERLAADRERFRDHLRAFGPDGETPYYDGDPAIDRRSDLYCYFLTQVTRFLREGARLAWIVPTKWMVADYGPSIRRFLLDHYRVEAVVGFRDRVFEDALVDTVLLLAERRADGGDRTATDFVRVDAAMDPGEVVEVVDRDRDLDGARVAIRGRSDRRVVSVRQSSLSGSVGENVHHYLDAPALYTAVLEHGDTVPLEDLATVTRGKKTGANPIFVLDGSEVESWGVESRFLRPAVKSVREVEGFEHTAADAERWMLDVHGYVQRVREREVGGGSDLAEAVRRSLRADGYDGLLSYLEWADRQPSRTNATLDGYDPWFDMGSLDGETAPVLCPQAMDTRRFFVRGGGSLAASNRFLLVDPDGHDADLLLGLLNSTLSKVVVESHGRVTGGGAVNLSASDLRSLRVVDPAALSDGGRTQVTDGFDRLADGDRSGLDAIDRAVIDALGLDASVAELRRIAGALKDARRAGGEADAPVEKLDELEGGVEMSFGAGGPRDGSGSDP